MLDAFIIQEIKRREQERLRQERARPQLHVPRDDDDPRQPKSPSESDREERSDGVVTIDL